MRKFLMDSIRVLKLARKPRKDEFVVIAKTTALGMIFIGAIGAFILLIATVLRG